MKRLALIALLVLLASGAQAADLAARQQAAAQAAQHAKTCTDIGDFYWEIGDAGGKLASGSVGSKYTSTTSMRIDSASKFVFGSYVLEKLGGKEPDEHQVHLLDMTGGYAHVKNDIMVCSVFARTVATCAEEDHAAEPHTGDIGIFAYGNQGDEELAVELGLGDKTKEMMAEEYKKYLGDDLDFSFRTLLFAGGLKSTPDNYARFLRKILSGKLRMKDHLGTHAVCASKFDCPDTVAVTPSPYFWHYSLNHWVEDGKKDDGAFSSPGLEGFYPWISADKTTYGIVARQVFGRKSWATSAWCGMSIRRAWMTGTAP
jgi:hypothetical protein